MNNRIIVGLFVWGMLLAGSASAAQRWGTGSRPDAGACFYEYPNFQGRYFCARAGEDLPSIPNGMNDRIASIRVFGNGQLVVYSYDRFRGAESWFDYDVRDLRDVGWDDRISSARLGTRSSRSRWDERFFQGRPPDRDQRFDQGGSRGDKDGPPRDRLRQDQSAPQQGSRGDAGAAMTREQAEAMVRAAYLSVLKREPDAAGSANWVSHVLNEHWTQQDLEREFRNSAEYKAKNPGR